MTVAKKYLAAYEEGWNVAELKVELQKRQMLATGNKDDLIECLAKEDQRLARKASAAAKKAEKETAIKGHPPGPIPAAPRREEAVEQIPLPLGELEQAEPVSILEALSRIGDYLAGEGVTITISGSRATAPAPAPTAAPAPTPQEPGATSREEVRDAARQLLAIQPDGRSRALNILGQYGGSVSAVPQEDLVSCLAGLTAELEAVS